VKVFIKEILPQGLRLEKTINPSEIGLTEDDFKSLSPLNVTADIERVGNTVLARTQIKTRLSFVCARCLETLEHDSVQDFQFDYLLEPTTEFIDLGEDIRQELIVGLPIRVLCKDDCKGICPKCGMNLNKEQCHCSKK